MRITNDEMYILATLKAEYKRRGSKDPLERGLAYMLY